MRLQNRNSMNQNENIAKNMMWNTIGNLVYCICQWVITILTVRLGSFSAAGYLSLAMSTSSTFSTIAMFSMRNYQVSDIKKEHLNSEYLGSRMITCVIAYALCSVYALKSNSLYQMLCIDAFMLIRIAESWVDVLHGIDQEYNRYDFIGKSYLFRGFATIVFFVLGIVVTSDILFAISICGIGNLMIMLVYDVRKTATLEKLSFSFSKDRILLLLKKCFPIVITSFLLSMIPLLPRTAIQTFVGNENLGVYSSIASPTLIVQVFATYAFNPLIPRIATMFNERRYDEFLNLFHKLLVVFAGFGGLITLGALLLGRLGLTILYGSHILDYYSYFMPLVWCTIFTAYVWILNSIVTSIRKIVPMMLVMVFSFGIDLIFNKKFIEQFSTNGASYIQLLSFIIIVVSLILIVELTVRKKKTNFHKEESL